MTLFSCIVKMRIILVLFVLLRTNKIDSVNGNKRFIGSWLTWQRAVARLNGAAVSVALRERRNLWRRYCDIRAPVRREPALDMEKGTGSRAPRETEEPEMKKKIDFIMTITLDYY